MAGDKQSEFAKEIDQYSKLKSGNRLQFLDETGAIFHYDLIKKASKQQNDYNVRSIITDIESSFLIENIVYISYDKNLVNPPSLKGIIVKHGYEFHNVDHGTLRPDQIYDSVDYPFPFTNISSNDKKILDARYEDRYDEAIQSILFSYELFVSTTSLVVHLPRSHTWTSWMLQ